MFRFLKKSERPSHETPAEGAGEERPEPPASDAAALDGTDSDREAGTGSASVALESISAATADAAATMEATGEKGWFTRLRAGLTRTRSSLGGLFGGSRIDETLYDELETALLSADAGVEATEALLASVRARVRRERIETPGELRQALAAEIAASLAPLERDVDLTRARPIVIMIAGVNGAGKTTSIGKIAKYLRDHGLSVLLAAGDTFRAAAREQLVAWGERNGVPVIAQSSGDAAAVVFDAVGAARARGIDVVLADTAGRLPTQLHLMEELKKVKRVIAKAQEGAPHEIWVVLDANTGQNAVNQVKAFDEALGLTGLILTKLDGTAKGGVVAAIARSRPVPLVFVGVGEGIDDLRPFAAREFAEALLD
jgi:fused signal recognition particle receptor